MATVQRDGMPHFGDDGDEEGQDEAEDRTDFTRHVDELLEEALRLSLEKPEDAVKRFKLRLQSLTPTSPAQSPSPRSRFEKGSRAEDFSHEELVNELLAQRRQVDDERAELSASPEPWVRNPLHLLV
jgi:hypothetical protein